MVSALNCELLDLRALVAVAEGRSFQQAAAQLNLSQPALSRRIQKLESVVGTLLLERTTRHVRLTPAGQEVLPLVRRLLEEMDGSLFGMMVSGERRAGRVTLASVPSAVVNFLPAVLDDFNTDFPQIRVRILDLTAVECAEAVRTGEAECGISLPIASDFDLVFEPLYTDQYGLACRPDDPLAALPNISWTDLADRRLVAIHRASGNRMMLEGSLAEAGIDLNWFYEVTRLTSAMALVQAGLGPSVLPRLACVGVEGSGLVWRPIEGHRVSRTLGLIRRPTASLSPPAARLIALLSAAWSQA